MNRRDFHRWCSSACALAAAGPARSRGSDGAAGIPTRVVVPAPPGTSPDVLARKWVQHYMQGTGQPALVDNRSGASTIIGTRLVAGAPADGHTLLWTLNSTFVINPFVFRELPYRLEDFQPITQVVQVPYLLLVGRDAPWARLEDLLEQARKAPDSLSYASAGVGSGLHLVMVRLLKAARAGMVHVPYRDAFMPDVAARRVDVAFDASTTAIAQVRQGQVRALAVASTQRLAPLPEVPTIAETLAGFAAEGWQGLFAPRATPADRVEALAAHTRNFLAAPEQQAWLHETGLRAVANSPATFAATLAADRDLWGQAVRESGLRPE